MSAPFVKTWVRLDTVESTSDLAKRLAAEGPMELPILVRATRQTRGRGRGAHAWWSDSGSLTFTIALDPAAHGLTPAHEPRLALATAVAVVDAVLPYIGHETAGIRWPNDVEVSGRKVAGILPERVETSRGSRLVIGIGVNVQSRIADAPAEVRAMAVSLGDVSPNPPQPEALLERLLPEFVRSLNALAAESATLAERWAALDTLRDQRLRIDLGSRTVVGIGCGIDSEGALCVATDTEVVRFFGGQVLRG